MKVSYLLLALLCAMYSLSCHSKNKTTMQEPQNPLLCNPDSGLCKAPADATQSLAQARVKSDIKPVKIIYYTDPICSACWGIEPQLRKLKLEYGNSIEIDYRMGGLLPDWSYNSGGISKPSDVAHHWDEVSAYYDMPIDGDIWLEDPLSSSFPPSIAFKAAQMQDKEKAVLFLRAVREMVFLQKKNISQWVHLELAAESVGLDLIQFKTDYEGKAKELFEADLRLGRELGVRGFPTVFFADSLGRREIVYGAKPYDSFEKALLKVYPAATKTSYDHTWAALFAIYPSLTAKEFSELSGTARDKTEAYLDELAKSGKLSKSLTKNGAIWALKKPSR